MLSANDFADTHTAIGQISLPDATELKADLANMPLSEHPWHKAPRMSVLLARLAIG